MPTFWENFTVSHCNQKTLNDNTSRKRLFEENNTFIFTRTLNIGNSTITADRYHVIHRFSYTILLNITGAWLKSLTPVKAENIISGLGQIGLKFLSKLDDFTINASATAKMESLFPVSTEYKMIVRPVDLNKNPSNK